MSEQPVIPVAVPTTILHRSVGAVQWTSEVPNPNITENLPGAMLVTNEDENPRVASLDNYFEAGSGDATLVRMAAQTDGPVDINGGMIPNYVRATCAAAGDVSLYHYAHHRFPAVGMHSTIGMWIRSDRPLQIIDTDCRFLNVGVPAGEGHIVTPINVPANEWRFVYGHATATAPYTQTQIALICTTEPGQVIDYTGGFSTSGGQVDYYFDGQTPDGGDHTFRWWNDGVSDGGYSEMWSIAAPKAGAYMAPNEQYEWVSSDNPPDNPPSSAAIQVAVNDLAVPVGIRYYRSTTIPAGDIGTFRVTGKAPLNQTWQIVLGDVGGAALFTHDVTGTGDWQDVVVDYESAGDLRTMAVQMPPGTPLGTTLLYDKVLMVAGPTAYDGPYFSGDTSSTDQWQYEWVAVPNESFSTAAPVTIDPVPVPPELELPPGACLPPVSPYPKRVRREVVVLGQVDRTNLASDPAATAFHSTPGWLGWRSTRWFGSAPAAGTYEIVNGALDGPLGTDTSYARKTWTVAPATMGGTGDTGFEHAQGGSNSFPVVPGQVISFSSWMRPSRERNFNIGVYQYDAAGLAFSTPRVFGPDVFSAGVWVRVGWTYTVPDGVAFINVVSDSNSRTDGGAQPWAVGDTLDSTGLLVEYADKVLPFFNGSTIDTDTDQYDWLGEQNASMSTHAPRRVVRYYSDYYELPFGEVPILRTRGTLLTHRRAFFTYELRTRDGVSKGPLQGVLNTGGSLTFQYDARLKAGGKLNMHDTGQEIDWLNDRIYIEAHVGDLSWGLGVYLPTAPIEAWASTHLSWAVELHSKLLVLDQHHIPLSYSLPAGTNVTDAVRTLIELAGEDAGAIEPGTATLREGMNWEAGTPILSMINNMLDAASYLVLQVDGNGQFQAYPYVVPGQRPVRYVFEDGPSAIYLGVFGRDQDIFSVPNRVVAISTGSPDEEALVAVAENMDPASPFSYPSRGRFVSKTFTGVEATSQSTLDTYARRHLVDDSAPRATVGIQHGLVPLSIYDATQFIYSPGGINTRYVVDKTEVSLDPTQLATTTLREVVVYDDAFIVTAETSAGIVTP